VQEAWLKILSQAKHLGATLFFGDEASFALWGSLPCTWAPKGHQPQIKTAGLHKGYKGFGAIEYFTSRSIYRKAHESAFKAIAIKLFSAICLRRFQARSINHYSCTSGVGFDW